MKSSTLSHEASLMNEPMTLPPVAFHTTPIPNEGRTGDIVLAYFDDKGEDHHGKIQEHEPFFVLLIWSEHWKAHKKVWAGWSEPSTDWQFSEKNLKQVTKWRPL